MVQAARWMKEGGWWSGEGWVQTGMGGWIERGSSQVAAATVGVEYMGDTAWVAGSAKSSRLGPRKGIRLL
jgi:hypothetical protein